MKLLISLTICAVLAVPSLAANICNFYCSYHNPVCGFDGKHYIEFNADCELKNANCMLANERIGKGKFQDIV